MKKALALILSVLMLVGSFSLMTSAAEKPEGVVGDVLWNEDMLANKDLGSMFHVTNYSSTTQSVETCSSGVTYENGALKFVGTEGLTIYDLNGVSLGLGATVTNYTITADVAFTGNVASNARFQLGVRPSSFVGAKHQDWMSGLMYSVQAVSGVKKVRFQAMNNVANTGNNQVLATEENFLDGNGTPRPVSIKIVVTDNKPVISARIADGEWQTIKDFSNSNAIEGNENVLSFVVRTGHTVIVDNLVVCAEAGQVQPEPSEQIRAVGFQRSVATDGTYSLRLICAAYSEELDNVGMKLVCGADNGQTWTFDTAAYKFDSITAGDTTISASEKGAAAFYTAVISDIPSDVGLFSVTVTPYYSDGSTVREQGTGTVIMNGTDVQYSKTYVLDEITDKLKISGRSAELDSGIACDFAASGIEFNATLAGNVKLKVKCNALTYYTLYLNGERQERLKFDAGEREYVIARDLPAQKYNVKLVKQTHLGRSTSELLELTAYGNISANAPADKDLYIEFIGDSITCGYGVVGYPTEGVTYYGTAEYCDATESYAYKTATALGADCSMIALSGWKMLEGIYCIPSIYDKTCFERGDEKYTPDRGADIVVINLGTNDYSYDTFETNFVDEYVDFVTDQVLAFNPDAKIILAYGMMQTGTRLANVEAKINTIVNKLGGAESGIYAVKLDYNQSGGDSHPSADGHTAAAKTLTDFIRANCL